MQKIPVTLLTGFLGSGKTTLLSKLLPDPALARTVVIINEFGAISIDHLIVANLTENIIELRNGCLCCTIRGDLVMTLRDLYRQRQLGEIQKFDRVIVETSGLADPVPLLHTLMTNPPLMQVFELDALLTVVDTLNAVATLPAHQTATDQIAMADILVLSKRDLATTAEWQATQALIDEINPGALRIEAVDGNVAAQQILGVRVFNPEARLAAIGTWMGEHGSHDHEHHGTRYASHVIVHSGAISLAGLSVFLNRLVNEQRDNILRIKGLAVFRGKGDKPAVIHAVQNKFYPLQWLLETTTTGDPQCKLVFIGRALDVQRIDRELAALCLE